MKAGGEYLQALPRRRPARASASGAARTAGSSPRSRSRRNSDVFAAGVDIHGVHDWIADFGRGSAERSSSRYEQGDSKRGAGRRVAVVTGRRRWRPGRSPVLLIQGDDDRNVRFHQTVDLARRLAAGRAVRGAGAPRRDPRIPAPCPGSPPTRRPPPGSAGS